MADDALRSAVHEAIYRVAARFGAGELAAIETADAECAALDSAFGAQRCYWPARDNRARNRQIHEDLRAGLPPAEVAAKHGVSLKTVTRANRRAQTTEPGSGFGADDWVLR